MAVIKKSKSLSPRTISSFLGLNENPDGFYNLKLGEASRMLNWRIAKEYQLKKREGFAKIFDLTTGSIQGMWYGEINGTTFFLFAHGGHLYSGNLITGIKTDLGTLTDAPTKFFYFDTKVYIVNGHEYKSFDGTTLVDVAGYRPLVAINCPPTGGIVINQSALYEEINNLTGAKHQTFSADGTAIEFQLAETEVDSLDFLKVDGEEDYLEDVNFKIDKVAGKLNTAPFDLAMGDSTTQIGITKISSSRYRYTWDSNGTNPNFDSILAVNDYVYITCESFRECNRGIFQVKAVGATYFEITNKNGKAESNKIYGKGMIYKRQQLGDSTTQVDISNTLGITYRYTFDGTGTDPKYYENLVVNDYVFINAENFSAVNNGVFQITAKGASSSNKWFEVTNADGLAETDKTMGTGGIYKCTCSGEPIGIVAEGQGNIDIGWTKGVGSRSIVENNKYFALFSGANDNRVFLYGNANVQNRAVYSGLADGVPSAEYFPANGYRNVGSAQNAITGLIRHYDRMIILTEKDAHYAYYDTLTLDSGQVVADFPTYSLNGVKGNVAPGQTQLINNNPFSVYQGVQQWNSSNVRDERNAVWMSKRVQPSLGAVDLSTAITYDWEENREYWLCVGSTVWIYNYGNDTWYKFDNIAATCFLTIDSKMYFGTNDGLINKFGEDLYSDNGTAINAVWEMGFHDFDAEWLTKFMNNIWVSIKPEKRSAVDIQTETNTDGISVKQAIYYNLATFKKCNFNHFSFHTSYNPQPFYLEVQATGFCYFRVILTNLSDYYKATILSINLPARYGGKIR